MMDNKEFLLTSAVKESSEMQKAICKALMFGLDDSHSPFSKDPAKVITNRQYIVNKFIDLVGIFDVLTDESVLNVGNIEEQVNAKKERIHKAMKFHDEKSS